VIPRPVLLAVVVSLLTACAGSGVPNATEATTTSATTMAR
jgi:hypothetical protein